MGVPPDIVASTLPVNHIPRDDTSYGLLYSVQMYIAASECSPVMTKQSLRHPCIVCIVKSL